MTLKGKYEQSHIVVKVFQWLGCIFLLCIPALASVAMFSDLTSVVAIKWSQLIQTLAVFLLPPLCMAYLWSRQPLAWLQLSRVKFNSGTTWLWAVVVMLVALPAINLLGWLNQQMSLPAFLAPVEAWMRAAEDAAMAMTQQMLAANTLGVLVVNLFLMAVLPAVAEELTFRGVLQQLVRSKRASDNHGVPHVAIWVTAILFSAIHLQFYGFVPRMLMGALFGYALVWTGSLWVPMLMHMTNNAMVVLLYYITQRVGWDMEKIDAIGTDDTLWLGVVSILLTAVGIYVLRRSTTMSNASSRISSGN